MLEEDCLRITRLLTSLLSPEALRRSARPSPLTVAHQDEKASIAFNSRAAAPCSTRCRGRARRACCTSGSTRTTGASRAGLTRASASTTATRSSRPSGGVRAAPDAQRALEQAVRVLSAQAPRSGRAEGLARALAGVCTLPHACPRRLPERRHRDRGDALPLQHPRAGRRGQQPALPAKQGDDLGRPPEPVHRRALVPQRGESGQAPPRQVRAQPRRFPPGPARSGPRSDGELARRARASRARPPAPPRSHCCAGWWSCSSTRCTSTTSPTCA